LAFSWPCIVTNSCNKSQLHLPISKIYFWNKTLHVSDSSFAHHQEFFTVHTKMVYVIQVTVRACEQDQDGNPSWFCSQDVSKPVRHIQLLSVRWKTPDDGQMNCPKYVEFYSKNKFEKLVHLLCFTTREKIKTFISSTFSNTCKFFPDERKWATELQSLRYACIH